jgi:UDP-N-acetylglucosamine--N-acetylmuramyl-(pentapeptide) pyrophosphoryl-undecaprenol N-acetylglucosamine transferase
LRKAVGQLKNIKPEFKKWGLEKGRFTIIAVGGSLGAEKINNTVINLYNYFKDNNKIQILLICGSRFYNQLMKGEKNIIESKGKFILKIFPYISEMQEIYRISDVIISRAGANTISEIIECNIPSILIPYPYAVANHQFYNADFLARKGKAILVEDKDLNEEKIIKIIELLIKDDRKRYKEMKNIEIRNAKINSAEIITSKLMEN